MKEFLIKVFPSWRNFSRQSFSPEFSDTVMHIYAHTLTPAEIAHISNILPTKPLLTRLKITGYSPELIDLNSLFIAIQKLPHLSSLEISDMIKSCLKENHFEGLLSFIKQRNNLQTLNLHGHNLSEKNLQRLCEALTSNQALREINLSSINHTHQHLEIIKAFIQKMPGLNSISIGEDEFYSAEEKIPEQALETFLASVETHPSLNSLYISYSDNDVLAEKLSKLLKHNHCLEKIVLKSSPQALTLKGMSSLIEALQINTTILHIKEGDKVADKTPLDKKLLNKMDSLLLRNQLLKAIKNDFSKLPKLLKQYKNAKLDNIFFIALIKLLPEPYLIKYNDLLTGLMNHRNHLWQRIKYWLNFQQDDNNIQCVMNMIAKRAHQNDAKCSMAAGYIYKNGLFKQAINPEMAQESFKKVLSRTTDTELLKEAYFEIGHLKFIYKSALSDMAEAAEHFCQAAKSSSEYIIKRLHDYSWNIFNQKPQLLFNNSSKEDINFSGINITSHKIPEENSPSFINAPLSTNNGSSIGR